MPKSWLLALRVYDDMEKYGHIIGIIFLSSIALTVASAVCKMEGAYHSWFLKRRLLQELKNLDKYEKSILRNFFLSEKHTLNMAIDDPIIVQLFLYILNTSASIP